MNLSGNPSDYLIVFFGGVLVSFTPCVYPLIPVSVGYIGVTSSGSRLKGFLLSLVYVTGVATTYSVMGLLAALTGSFFGQISAHPATGIVAGLIIVVFGFSMLGAFHLSMPRIFHMRSHKKHSFLSTYFLGVSSGLMASPCLTPVLGSILVYLSSKGSLWYGATLLFVFAYGMGFLLIIVGTFSSLVMSLPRLGVWMGMIKKILAYLLIGVGVYFIVSALWRM